jgi:hypothetical protein
VLANNDCCHRTTYPWFYNLLLVLQPNLGINNLPLVLQSAIGFGNLPLVLRPSLVLQHILDLTTYPWSYSLPLVYKRTLD